MLLEVYSVSKEEKTSVDSTLACQAPWAWVEDSESIGRNLNETLNGSSEEDEKMTLINDHEKIHVLWWFLQGLW